MKYTLLKFSASWCGPCQQLAEMLKNDPIEIPDVAIKTVDVDEEERLADAFDIQGVPAMVLVKDGHVELGRLTGLVPREEIVEFIKSKINEE